MLKIKGKARDENMPLLPEAREALLKLAGGRPITEPVFISYRGRRLGVDMAEIVIKEIFRRAGINGIKQSPLTLRHTFATLATVAGCDTYSVERLLRHRSSGWNVTYHYIHLSIQELMGKLEKYSLLRTVMGDSSKLLVCLNPGPAPSLPETDPAQLLPVLLNRLIDLGDLARQISHALSDNGNRPDKLPEVIHKLTSKGGKSGHE